MLYYTLHSKLSIYHVGKSRILLFICLRRHYEAGFLSCSESRANRVMRAQSPSAMASPGTSQEPISTSTAQMRAMSYAKSSKLCSVQQQLAYRKSIRRKMKHVEQPFQRF